MPTPIYGESKKEFVQRYMKSSEARKSFPDSSQRYAVAHSVWKKHNSPKGKK